MQPSITLESLPPYVPREEGLDKTEHKSQRRRAPRLENPRLDKDNLGERIWVPF